MQGGVVAAKRKGWSVTTKEEISRTPESQWNAQPAENEATTQEQLDAALSEIKRLLGESFPASIVDKIIGTNGERWSGEWSKEGIKVARGASDPVGTGRHEALHQVFEWLRENGGKNVVGVIENLATNGMIKRQLARLLHDSPEAIKQLDTPEEAAAFLFQFWQAGQVTIGPKTVRTGKLVVCPFYGACSTIGPTYSPPFKGESDQEITVKTVVAALLLTASNFANAAFSYRGEEEGGAVWSTVVAVGVLIAYFYSRKDK
jgi:hypothetical protein